MRPAAQLDAVVADANDANRLAVGRQVPNRAGDAKATPFRAPFVGPPIFFSTGDSVDFSQEIMDFLDVDRPHAVRPRHHHGKPFVTSDVRLNSHWRVALDGRRVRENLLRAPLTDGAPPSPFGGE